MTAQSITSFMGHIVPGSKKKRYLLSRQRFYETRNYLSSIDKLSSLVRSTSANSLQTKKSIRFYGLEFGLSLKEAIAHLGKPNFMSKNPIVLKRHQVIYYRISIAQVKCLLQLHFLHDQFFLGLIEVRNSNGEMRQNVTGLIKEKYGIENKQWDGCITDSRGYKIEFKNDIIPYITYYSNAPQIKELIKLQLETLEAERTRHYKKQSNLLLDMI